MLSRAKPAVSESLEATAATIAGTAPDTDAGSSFTRCESDRDSAFDFSRVNRTGAGENECLGAIIETGDRKPRVGESGFSVPKGETDSGCEDFLLWRSQFGRMKWGYWLGELRDRGREGLMGEIGEERRRGEREGGGMIGMDRYFF